MSQKKSLMSHGEVQKLMTNYHRPNPKGVPATAKGPKQSKGSNGAPKTRASNDPRKQYQGVWNSGANRKYSNRGDEEGYD